MKKHNGFTLVEIMVCVVILSTGLLGLIGLQATGLKNSLGSYHRTQAAFLARNIADKIRLNFYANPNNPNDPVSVAQKKENIDALNRYLYQGIIPPAWKSADCLTATGCDRIAMAKNDIFEWKRLAVRRILPMASNIDFPATITCQTLAGAGCCPNPANSDTCYVAADDVFTITISWDENRNGKIDNRDSVNPANACFNDKAMPTLNPKPVQYDPCFRTDFKL